MNCETWNEKSVMCDTVKCSAKMYTRLKILQIGNKTTHTKYLNIAFRTLRKCKYSIWIILHITIPNLADRMRFIVLWYNEYPLISLSGPVSYFSSLGKKSDSFTCYIGLQCLFLVFALSPGSLETTLRGIGTLPSSAQSWENLQ